MSKVKSLWTVEGLRKRILYTLMILLVYRIGCNIPVPNINRTLLSAIYSLGLFGYMDMLSGGAIAQAGVLSLGIAPYINTSIVFELLAVAIPRLGELRKDPEGKKKYQRYMSIATAGVALLMAISYYVILQRQGALMETGAFATITIVLLFITGSMACMWLANKIDDNGLGNGASLLIFAGIVSRWFALHSVIAGGTAAVQSGQWLRLIGFVMIVLLLLASVVYIVYINGSERRIPVNYASATRGQKTYRRHDTFIPLKVMSGGVMPVIFASSILSLPQTIGYFINAETHPALSAALLGFDSRNWLYISLFVALIFIMTWFYLSIQIDPIEMSNNLRQSGGAIPGIRPGAPTSSYIRQAVHELAPAGGLALSIVAVLPMLFGLLTGIAFPFGGTSLIITVSVCLELVAGVDAFLSTRHYSGFID